MDLFFKNVELFSNVTGAHTGSYQNSAYARRASLILLQTGVITGTNTFRLFAPSPFDNFSNDNVQILSVPMNFTGYFTTGIPLPYPQLKGGIQITAVASGALNTNRFWAAVFEQN